MRCFARVVDAFRNVRAPFEGDFSRIADAIRNIRAPLGQCFLPSQMQFVAFGRRSGEISRRSPMRFCFPLTCLNDLVGERLPSSTRQQKCGGAREHRRMCASTQQRAPSAQLACKPHFPVERKAAIALPSSDVALCASCQCKTAGHLPHGPRNREQV